MILAFLGGIIWGAGWHFSSYIIKVTIKKDTWADVAGKTTGVIATFPFVLEGVVKFAKMSGVPECYEKQIRVGVTCGYFMAYLAGGIGKVVGTALDEWLYKGD